MAKDAPCGARGGPGIDHHVGLLLGAIPAGLRLVVSAEQAGGAFHSGLADRAFSRSAFAVGGPHLHLVESLAQTGGRRQARPTQPDGSAWVSQRRRIRTADGGALWPVSRRGLELRNS